MATSSTLTVRLPEGVKDRLGKLASGTRRTKSFLAAEAIEAYVDRETAIVEAIEEGMASLRAGDVIPHEDVVAEAEELLSQLESAHRK